MYQRFTPALLALFVVAVPAVAEAQARGRIECTVTENGGAGTGSMTVTAGGATVASSSCDRPVAVPAGSYQVRIELDGAIDRPERSQSVTVRAGRSERVAVDFQTGTLEVQNRVAGRRAPGVAEVRRNGAAIGNVTGGVGAKISAGTYEIIVRARGQERSFASVSIAPGERRVVSADF